MARLQVVVPLALLIVLALLYGALESGRAAMLVLLIAPIAMTGGLFALRLGDLPLSVSAAVGFIALLGQVSLAGLLVLSAVEDRRRDGMPLRGAILTGATDRFRAVLMASLLAALGLLPMATSTGVGSETQRPFALVIVGGMVTTLLVVLLVLPILYEWLAPATAGATDDDADDLLTAEQVTP